MNSGTRNDAIAITNAVLSGWNIGLLAAFVTAIVLVALFGGEGGLRGRASIAAVVVAAVLVGGALGYVFARGVARWFANRRPVIARTWLIGLVVITLLSFPGFFRFSV
jgi:predicted Na+-dependent transporter